jgi:hypothetical protein
MNSARQKKKWTIGDRFKKGGLVYVVTRIDPDGLIYGENKIGNPTCFYPVTRVKTPLKIPKEVWVNLYDTGFSTGSARAYTAKEDADRGCLPDRLACRKYVLAKDES